MVIHYLPDQMEAHSKLHCFHRTIRPLLFQHHMRRYWQHMLVPCSHKSTLIIQKICVGITH